MKKPNPRTDSQCGQEYMISFFTNPDTSLCTSSVDSADSLVVFSKVIACLQYGHFGICFSLCVECSACRFNHPTIL